MGVGLIHVPDDPEEKDERSEKYFDKFRYNRARIPFLFSSCARGHVSPVKDQKDFVGLVLLLPPFINGDRFKKITGVSGTL